MRKKGEIHTLTPAFLHHGIAASVILTYCNACCEFNNQAHAELVSPFCKYPQTPTAIRDYALNNRFVMAMQTVGLGSTDLTQILGSIGVKSTPCPRHVWDHCESSIGTVERAITDAIIRKTFERTSENTGKNKNQKYHLPSPAMNSDHNQQSMRPGIAVSFDMGWNTRSSGNMYNSLSGQAVMYGCHTGQPIAWRVIAKQCNVCQKATNQKISPDPHECPRNYSGSSKAMEAEAARRMLISLWAQRYHVTYIVGDDDATTRAILQPTGHRKLDKGKLDHAIPPPIWLADPGHHIKAMAAPFFALAKQPKSQLHCSIADAYRIKNYYGCAVRQN